MSLHDISKDHNSRSKPKPNTDDGVGNRMAHGTTSSNFVTDANDGPSAAGIKLGFSRMVKSGSATIINDGSALTTTTVSHNLGYAPLVVAYMNNSDVSGDLSGTVLEDVNLPLPIFTSLAIDSGTPTILFQTWIYPLVDDTNVYFQTINSTGEAISVTVTYYLFQQVAG